MRFFHIPSAPNDPTNPLFAEACARRRIDYVAVFPHTLRYALQSPPTRGDLLYCAGSSATHRQVEGLFATDGVTTFHRIRNAPFIRRLSGKSMQTLLLHRNGVGVPNSVFYIQNDSKTLMEAVDSVGGFPVVLKATDGHHGAGVIRVDNPATLTSVVNFVLWKGESTVIMQEYIDHASTLKLICIGDRIAAGVRLSVPRTDFRSNTVSSLQAGGLDVVPLTEFATALTDLAVSATCICGHDCAVVSVIEAVDGRQLVSKVRFPLFPADFQLFRGSSLATLMLDHLVNKQRLMAGGG